jgi:hypothetical protein
MDNNNSSQNIVAKRHQTKEMAVLEIHGRTLKIQCRLSNLSITGAFLELTSFNYLPRQGDLVRMTVNLRQVNKTYKLNGQVVWSRGLGLGVSFLKDKELFAILSRAR